MRDEIEKESNKDKRIKSKRDEERKADTLARFSKWKSRRFRSQNQIFFLQ